MCDLIKNNNLPTNGPCVNRMAHTRLKAYTFNTHYSYKPQELSARVLVPLYEYVFSIVF